MRSVVAALVWAAAMSPGGSAAGIDMTSIHKFKDWLDSPKASGAMGMGGDGAPESMPL